MWSTSERDEKDRYINDVAYFVSDFVTTDAEEILEDFRISLSNFQGHMREKQSQGVTLENNAELCRYALQTAKKICKIFCEKYATEYPSGQRFAEYSYDRRATGLLVQLFSEAESKLAHLENQELGTPNEDIEEEDASGERRRGRRKRRFQVHPILQDRHEFGFYERLVPELKKDPEKFKNYTRMSEKQFNYLAAKIRSEIERSNDFRISISPDARLLITLRHLATGDSFASLSYDYLAGISTIAGIVSEVCQVIWTTMSHLYIVWPINLDAVAKKFEVEHRFPHCCGAVDGKHVRIQKPQGSGGAYYNFKGFHSIVLLGICDANCNFMYASIGSYGSQSDKSVYIYSDIGQAIVRDELVWPESKCLPGSEIPFHHFIIGDEAFPLSDRLFRPYSGRNLPENEAYFNSRFATARNTIERTFGILTSRFRIFRGEILSSPKNAEKIVKACVTLHNYIRKTSDSNTPHPLPSEIQNDLISDPQILTGRLPSTAAEKRNIYKQYLIDQRNQ